MLEQTAMQPTANQQTQKNKYQAQRIAQLVRAGLMKPNELAALKVALTRHSKVQDVAKLPRNQRDILNRYYQSTSDAALATQQSTMAVRRNLSNGYEISRDDFITESTFNDPPMMLILKRRGVRIFPDGKRVALYQNDKLNLSFTIPYTSNGAEQEIVGVKEELEILESIEQLALIEENTKKKMVVGNKPMDVTHQTAMHILNLHSQLNDKNKKALEKHIKDPKNFAQIAKFAKAKANAKKTPRN